jgi:hypothetical protein
MAGNAKPRKPISKSMARTKSKDPFRTHNFNAGLTPFEVIALKQKVGQDDADKIAMPLLAYLDAAKRAACPNTGINFITRHLICALYLARRVGDKAFHACAMSAYEQLRKASERPTEALDLTTGEYHALRKAIAAYLLALPKVEVGMMAEANAAAAQMMGIDPVKETADLAIADQLEREGKVQ